MKVLVINGSPNVNGNTKFALNEIIKILNEEDIETEVFDIGKMDIRGCADCSYCHTNGKCAFDDVVNVVAEKFKDADGMIVGSPVYYSAPNGTVLSFMQRLFHSIRYDCTTKVGATIACARRAGTTSTLDALNKYFTYVGMPLATSSTYWNVVFGNENGDVVNDEEGIQIMQNLARDMAFLIKSIDLGKKEFGAPLKVKGSRTNFIR